MDHAPGQFGRSGHHRSNPIYIMRDQNHRPRALQNPGHDVFDQCDRIRIEGRVGLVEEQQIWLQHDLPGKLDPPLHAERGFPGGPVCRFRHADGVQCGGRTGERDSGDPCGELEIAQQAEFGIEGGAVPDQTEPGANSESVGRAEVDSKHSRGPGARLEQGGDYAQQGCLSRSVRAEQADRFAGGNRQVDIAQYGGHPDAHPDTAEFDMEVGCRHSPGSLNGCTPGPTMGLSRNIQRFLCVLVGNELFGVESKMPTVELTKDNFEETIVNNDIVLVDFWADWCGPCKMFAPTYEKASENHDGVVFAKVDTEAEQELAAYFQIRSIPTLMIFRDQIGIFSQPGALPEAALEDLISQTKALDMDAVRKEIEEQSADHEHGDGHDH